MQRPKELNAISWIDNDPEIVSGVLDPLREDGVRIDTYETYIAARNAIAAISKTDLLLLDIMLPPGIGAGDIPSPERDYLGIKLLVVFRDSGLLMPAVFFSTSYLPDVPGIGLTRDDLNATHIPKITSRSILRDHIYERFNSR